MVTCTGHIGIHERADGRTDVRTYVRTDVDDVMAIKPNFLTSMGYHIFLTMVLRARAPSARAELRYDFESIGQNSLQNRSTMAHTVSGQEMIAILNSLTDLRAKPATPKKILLN